MYWSPLLRTTGGGEDEISSISRVERARVDDPWSESEGVRLGSGAILELFEDFLALFPPVALISLAL